MSDDDSVTCDYCGTEFTKPQALAGHMTNCTADDPNPPDDGTDAADVAAAPAEAINGYGSLYPRQVTPHKTVVLSLRNGDPTAYHVNIAELDCDCPDESFNKSAPEICDHVAVALLEARKEYHVEKELAADLSSLVRDLGGAADQARDAAAYLEDALIQYRDMAAGEAATDDGAGETVPEDPEDRLKAVLEGAGIPADDVKVWVDDEYDSLQFEADNMDRDDFETFRDWCQDHDAVNWDRDNRRNYVRRDDFEEVLG